MKMSEIAKLLKCEAERWGASEVRLERGKSHPKITGIFGGRRFCYGFPSTPSDWRSAKNSVSDLRRAMGIAR